MPGSGFLFVKQRVSPSDHTHGDASSSGDLEARAATIASMDRESRRNSGSGSFFSSEGESLNGESKAVSSKGSERSPLAIIRRMLLPISSPTSERSNGRDAARGGKVSAGRRRKPSAAVEMVYPMWLVPLHHFLGLDELLPHQEMLRRGKLVRWQAGLRTVIFISHQWTSFDHPDHSKRQLQTAQRMLVRMFKGDVPEVEPGFVDQVGFAGDTKILPDEWKHLLDEAFIWIDFCAVPQTERKVPGATSDGRYQEQDEHAAAQTAQNLAKAVSSIPAYIERATHFFVLCPELEHRDMPGVKCNLSSWLDRGWCRVEMMSLLLACRKRRTPIVLIQSSEGPPSMLSCIAACSRPPGLGNFTCCDRDHQIPASNGGEPLSIPCDRDTLSRLMLRMLRKKSEYEIGACRYDEARLWKAHVRHFMAGLPFESNEVESEPEPDEVESEAEFRREYGFDSDHEYESSALSLLVLAVASGNLPLARKLAEQNPASTTARTKRGFPSFGLPEGLTPMHFVSSAPKYHAELIRLLMKHGADPNAKATKTGVTPLVSAVANNNLEMVNALTACPDVVIDAKLPITSDTALGVATMVAASPKTTLRLLELGADAKHISYTGASKLHTCVENPSTTLVTIETICERGRLDVNQRRIPRTRRWFLIWRAFEIAYKRGIAASGFVSEMAHARGSTPLHEAARVGRVDIVRWLLDKGASPMIKNAIGCTPLEIARIFGPHHEIEAALARAVLRETQRTGATGGRPAQSTEFPMYVLPLSELLGFTVLPHHEELLAQNRLIQWQPSMQTICVSIEWSSLEHPDADGARLSILQRTFIRMMQGAAGTSEPSYSDRKTFSDGLKITAKDWQQLALNAFIWTPFVSLPLIDGEPKPITANLYATYLRRCQFFFAVCPPVKHLTVPSRTCNYASWLRNGQSRFELTATTMLSRPRKPAVIIRNSHGVMSMITPREPVRTIIGRGEFPCCRQAHTVLDKDGNQRTLPCARTWIGAQTWLLLSEHIDAQLREPQNALDRFRLWRAMVPRLLEGIACDETPALPARLEDLATYFRLGDDQTQGQSESGVTPVVLCVCAGLAECTVHLLEKDASDATTLVQLDVPALGICKGFTPLHLAVSMCPSNQFTIISALLRHGADPNASHGSLGFVPISVAAVVHNQAGLEALITCAGSRLDIEKRDKAFGATPLHGAAYFGSPECIMFMLAHGADVKSTSGAGYTSHQLACSNLAASPKLLDELLEAGEANAQSCPQTSKNAIVSRVFEAAVKHKVWRSSFALGMAHSRGATALHRAVISGHTELVSHLVSSGSYRSLAIRDAMGCTPLQVASKFGSPPDIESMLAQAAIRHKFERRWSVMDNGHLRRQGK